MMGVGNLKAVRAVLGSQALSNSAGSKQASAAEDERPAAGP